MADENPPNQGNADNDNNNQRRGNNGRNNRERGVRGPTSALSSFLREKGISVPTNPYARIQQQNASNETLSEIDSAKDVDEIQESTLDGQNGASNLHDVVPEFPAKKEEPMPVPKRKRRIPDDEDFLKLIKLCGTCKRRFISHSEQAFCHACLSVGAKSSKAVKKQRKKQQSVVY